jgi:hypothetical protein
MERADIQGRAIKICDFDASPYASERVYYIVREIDTKPWWGRANKICDFDASLQLLLLVGET